MESRAQVSVAQLLGFREAVARELHRFGVIAALAAQGGLRGFGREALGGRGGEVAGLLRDGERAVDVDRQEAVGEIEQQGELGLGGRGGDFLLEFAEPKRRRLGHEASGEQKDPSERREGGASADSWGDTGR